MPHHDASCDLAPALGRHIGRTLAMIAGAILAAIVVVHGESWAIRQAPLLLSDAAMGLPMAGCIADDAADALALPIAILH